MLFNHWTSKFLVISLAALGLMMAIAVINQPTTAVEVTAETRPAGVDSDTWRGVLAITKSCNKEKAHIGSKEITPMMMLTITRMSNADAKFALDVLCPNTLEAVLSFR